jgi:adenylate kinase family enzyme
MQRIVVVGTSGAGKTTLARRLSARLGVPHIELDAFHWEPQWKEAAPEVFRARVAQALAAPGWVADGNYSAVRDLVWNAADTVVWLDYSLPRIFWQTLQRTLHRTATHEVLWSGNRESFRDAFFSRKSILLWVLRTYYQRRRQYPDLLARPEHAHLTVRRLRSPQAVNAWVAELDRE